MTPFVQLLLATVLQLGFSVAYQNPIRDKPAPDPSLVYADGYYYLTYTGYTQFEIIRSRTLGGLASGESRVIWTDTNTTRNANMWAPEIHHIDNTWYYFYSSCDASQACCDSCQTRVLKGCDGPNPYDCDYEFLATLVPPEGSRGSSSNLAFSIDGSYLEIPGRGRYHVLSIVDEKRLQSIAITELNTTDWTVNAWHIISQPDQEWEQHYKGNGAVNEAPHPLYHGDDIWLAYSGSDCSTAFYALGLLYYNGGDPLQASSWDKSGPVLSQANGNYGTGHNSFFKSPDGKEIWNAFHATANSDGDCGRTRYTMAQKVTFDKNNVPNFGIPQPLGAELDPPSGECQPRKKKTSLRYSSMI
ncbi:unnamed protein product [Clonostachys rosea f. rosea IK726]|uniref:Uncharacterized protein n=1 Tax=Clonostachys rosea f. rosea IK726 TaxID=1349383 RepID=A0ACA9TZ49_BIOOC|nr:unnamed protein product [Clonostachys rosea f. rosea IK726]